MAEKSPSRSLSDWLQEVNYDTRGNLAVMSRDRARADFTFVDSGVRMSIHDTMNRPFTRENGVFSRGIFAIR
jgi:hypothetical protein